MLRDNHFKFAITKNYNEKLLSEGYKSLIVAVFPYFYPEKTELFSKYCSIYDYHTVIKEEFDKLIPLLTDSLGTACEYKIFADISPFPEKKLAESLSLGEIGKHNLLLTKKYSSFVFIGEAAIKAYLPETKFNFEKICMGCGECVRACPTGALTGGFNKEKCLSCITQKRKLTLEQELLLKNTQCVFGCDICQLACPITKNAQKTKIEKFKKPILDLTKEMILNMDNQEFSKKYHEFAFAYKGIEILKRNINLQ